MAELSLSSSLDGVAVVCTDTVNVDGAGVDCEGGADGAGAAICADVDATFDLSEVAGVGNSGATNVPEGRDGGIVGLAVCDILVWSVDLSGDAPCGLRVLIGGDGDELFILRGVGGVCSTSKSLWINWWVWVLLAVFSDFSTFCDLLIN